MTAHMTIGDFSRSTRLSAKALRLYHRIGLLEPVEVDPVTGYRFYGVEQIDDAQVIRHLRSLDMPLELVAQVVAADQQHERDRLIAGHLRQMEERLAATTDAVVALRSLLSAEERATVVERRSVPATRALVVRDDIALTDLGTWFAGARAELERLVPNGAGAGPLGGLWSTELVVDERGGAALFRPIGAATVVPDGGRARIETLPAVVLAVATHRGPDATVGQVYAELGEHVARHETGVDGPVRETYLAGEPGGEGVTEIGWPIR